MATFAENLRQATQEFVETSLGISQIPNWNRVLSAVPDFFDLMPNSVETNIPKVQNHVH